MNETVSIEELSIRARTIGIRKTSRWLSANAQGKYFEFMGYSETGGKIVRRIE